MVFTFHKKIYGYECDIYGHLNNANYLHLLESARSEALQDMKMPLVRLRELGIQLFVYRFELDYLKPLELEEVAVVKSSFFEMNPLKGRWQQEVFNHLGEKCLNAVLTVVFAAEGRAKRLPKEVYEQFKQFIEPAQDS